jgi:hypothetical protein
MREGLRRTSEFHILADVIPASLAELTFAAWQANLKSNPISNLKAIDGRSNFSHHSGGFMSQRQRLSDYYISIAVVVEVVEV